MPSMPRRPENHRKEEASERAFRQEAPDGWLIRRVDNDYGIDLEVELFDGDAATALTFKVQLKAKRVARGKPLSKSVAMSNLNYWLAHDVPVLVVLYDT
jgi:hypothetical protein